MNTMSNTEFMCSKAYKKMWILRKLKSLGCLESELLDVLRQQTISVCEVAVPYWSPMITVQEDRMIECILCTGLHIIYRPKYICFKKGLKMSNMSKLSTHREKMILSFTKKILKNDKYTFFFFPKPEVPDLS